MSFAARLALGGALWVFLQATWAAPDMPAVMVFVGEIVAGVGNAPPMPGDKVLAFDAADNQFVGSGLVGRNGDYHAVVSRTASYNGRTVVFELQQGRRRFALEKMDGTPALVRFAGRLLPIPISLGLRSGVQTAVLSIAEAAEPAAQRLSRRTDLPCDAQADVNEDGRCDELDMEILRLYGGGISRSVGRP